MRNLLWVGVLLVILGVAGLAMEYITVTEKRTVAEIGPLELKTEEQHNIQIPTIAGVIAVIAGLVMIVASRRTA